MLCTEAKWCDFYLRTAVDVHIKCVPFDEEFCLSKITMLREFYFCAILPEFAVPRDPIREPHEWISHSESWIERTALISPRAPDLTSWLFFLCLMHFQFQNTPKTNIDLSKQLPWGYLTCKNDVRKNNYTVNNYIRFGRVSRNLKALLPSSPVFGNVAIKTEHFWWGKLIHLQQELLIPCNKMLRLF